MTLGNTQNISDWEITLLKRQKSYAISALGELKGKVIEFKSKFKENLRHEFNFYLVSLKAGPGKFYKIVKHKKLKCNSLKIFYLFFLNCILIFLNFNKFLFIHKSGVSN